MSVTYLITFNVVHEQRERFLVLLNDVIDAMSVEETFIDATLHMDPADENRFLLYETWADHQDVIDNQIKRPYREPFHKALPELLTGPRGLQIWAPLRSLKRPAEAPPA
ncbi:antibiotic biosynthesis monooxygenase [Acetobacteraceae bacterium H6797]|nr:antibiotic biosynthesis monooxygenase [Acetobacteraceae bacterium H6797]